MTRIDGGTATNIVPVSCRFGFDVRALPGLDVDAIDRRIRAFADDECLPEMRRVAPEAGIDIAIANQVPPFAADASSEVVALALKLAGQNETHAVSYATEAGLFQDAGSPAVVFGPGDIAQAHTADEWIAKDQIEKCMAFLGRLGDWAEHGSAVRLSALTSLHRFPIAGNLRCGAAFFIHGSRRQRHGGVRHDRALHSRHSYFRLWLCSQRIARGARRGRPIDGQIAFNNACRTCHSFKEGDNRLGPSLARRRRPQGRLDRRAFAFSSSMKSSGVTWDEATLDKFIADPDQVVNGNKMKPFGGIADAGERKKIVGFSEVGRRQVAPASGDLARREAVALRAELARDADAAVGLAHVGELLAPKLAQERLDPLARAAAVGFDRRTAAAHARPPRGTADRAAARAPASDRAARDPRPWRRGSARAPSRRRARSCETRRRRASSGARACRLPPARGEVLDHQAARAPLPAPGVPLSPDDSGAPPRDA